MGVRGLRMRIKLHVDVGLEKEQKQELRWRVSVFHHCELY